MTETSTFNPWNNQFLPLQKHGLFITKSFATEAARDSYYVSNPDELKHQIIVEITNTPGGPVEYYQYIGTAWVQVTPIVKGDTGAQGPQGPTGATGPQGIQGPQGEAGSIEGEVTSIQFDIDAGYSVSEGEIAWNEEDGTLDVGIPGGNVTLQVGQEMHLKAKNDTGADIPNGSTVYISGASGSKPLITLADASLEATSSKTIGVTTEIITDGQQGYVTIIGLVRDIDTSGIPVGTNVWLSETAGGMTNSIPASPAHAVFIGVCLRSHATEGSIWVKVINGYELKEIHDVLAPTPSNKDVLAYDNSNSLWINEARTYDSSELESLLSLFNGTIVETFDATVSSDGATITMSLEKSGTGDLTMCFSDGFTTLDCTPACTIALTAGSIAAPQENFIYIPQSTKVLTKSTTDWPSAEHIKVAYFFVQTAAYVQTEGALINQNWNEHASNTTTNQGHLSHIGERIRREGSVYFSGIDGAGGDDYTTSSASTVTVHSTSGVVYQMHKQAYPAKDTSVSDDVHVVNAHATDGGAYFHTQNLFDITVDSTGSSLTNKFFNVVLWGVCNKDSEYGPLMMNLPSGSYNVLADAQNDVDGYDNFAMPREFNLESSTGFLIARLTFRKIGTLWTYQSTVDLRGQTPTTAAGAAGAGVTEFSDNQFKIFNVTDSTKEIDFDVSGVTTGTTRTFTAPDRDVTLGESIRAYHAFAYGITGDGSTDDTSAIQALIDTVEAAGGGIIYLPEGKYVISSTLTIESPYVQLVGAGQATPYDFDEYNSTPSAVTAANRGLTEFMWGASGGTMVEIKAADASNPGGAPQATYTPNALGGNNIRGISFIGWDWVNDPTATKIADYGLWVSANRRSEFTSLFFFGFTECALYLEAASQKLTSDPGGVLDTSFTNVLNVDSCLFEDIRFWQVHDTETFGSCIIATQENWTTYNISNNTFRRINGTGDASIGFDCRDVDSNLWESCGALVLTNYGWHLGGKRTGDSGVYNGGFGSKGEMFKKFSAWSVIAAGTGDAVHYGSHGNYTTAALDHEIRGLDLGNGSQRPIVGTGATLRWTPHLVSSTRYTRPEYNLQLGNPLNALDSAVGGIEQEIAFHGTGTVTLTDFTRRDQTSAFALTFSGGLSWSSIPLADGIDVTIAGGSPAGNNGTYTLSEASLQLKDATAVVDQALPSGDGTATTFAIHPQVHFDRYGAQVFELLDNATFTYNAVKLVAATNINAFRTVLIIRQNASNDGDWPGWGVDAETSKMVWLNGEPDIATILNTAGASITIDIIPNALEDEYLCNYYVEGGVQADKVAVGTELHAKTVLTTESEYTDTSGTIFGNSFVITMNQASAGTASLNGVSSYVQKDDTYNNTGVNSGAIMQFVNAGTGDVQTSRALLIANTQNNGSSTTTNQTGVFVQNSAAAGTVTTQTGIELQSSVVGTVTTLNHIHIEDAFGAGSVTTQRGILIDSLTKGSTDEAIRVNGTAPCIFGGDLTVAGTTNTLLNKATSTTMLEAESLSFWLIAENKTLPTSPSIGTTIIGWKDNSTTSRTITRGGSSDLIYFRNNGTGLTSMSSTVRNSWFILVYTDTNKWNIMQDTDYSSLDWS
jgi:hypothetical protein